jgi:hypothetical protein
MVGTTSESKLSYKCRYCEKEFRKESTLAVHQCELKRRWQQERETGVQWGLRAYLRFYEVTQGSARLKSYEDFVTSPYYSAFVRYGRYGVAIRHVNFISYTDWLLKNNKKLDNWCKDSLYEEWLNDYLRRENVKDALERGLQEMQEYADTHPDLKNGFRDYFRYGNANRICHHVTAGRISPWIIFNCDSGIAFLEGLDQGLLTIVLPWIDPDYWHRKLQDYLADTEWCKHILKEAGL